MQERPGRVTIYTGASVTISRPDIVGGQPERKLSRPYVLQRVYGETIPVVKETRIELTLERRTLRFSVHRRYKRRVYHGAGYPAGLRRVSVRGTPYATTRPRLDASERSSYSKNVNALAAYPEP
jgi:hypothetical protein